MNNEQPKERKKYKRPLLHKIVNVFIGLVAGLLFLLILFFGFSQTKTFRNILKNQITQIVNNSINGNLQIESIDGSILSSIILHNTTLVSENDTILNIEELVVKTSPIHILLKRILVREIIVKDVKLKLLEDKDGQWNLSKLSRSEQIDSVGIESPDSNISPFPFSIQVNNLSFQNLNFIRQSYQNLGSNKKYKFLTTDDLQLNEIWLDAKIFANLSASTIKLNLNNFSFSPNFKSFNLKKLSGEFELTEHYARINNLNLVSDSSNIKLSAQINELNLLGNVELKDFKEYPTKLSFQAFPLTFSDLYTFIENIDFLNGKAFLEMDADGYFGNFDVSKLNMSFLNSIVSMKGNVQKLHTPENLFLDINIIDSKILESDAYLLIKGLEIPRYENLLTENLNVSFKGEPTRFHTTLTSNVNNGSLFIDTFMDLQKDQMEYDINFNSVNVDLFPIFGIETAITSKGTIKGNGTDPNEMNANLNIQAFNSLVDSIEIDSLNLISSINSKLLDINLASIINEAPVILNGKLDLRNSDEPIYNLTGQLKGLQLNKFTGDIRDSSNLNLEFKVDGKNLVIDKMVGQYEVALGPSFLGDLFLDETKISLELIKNGDERNITLKSDFADFNIDGQFSLEKAIDIIVYESSTITQIINSKLDELNPIDYPDSTLVVKHVDIIPEIVKENLEFTYNFLFKDFELIAEILKNDELDITGSGKGTVKNDSLHFEISTDISIENLLNKRKNDILYFSNVEANLNFSRDNREISFNKMFGTVSIEGEKIYAGVELNEIEADLVFNQSKLFFNTSVNIENKFLTEVEGIAITSAKAERIDISNISINYNNLPWTNYDTCIIIFNEDGVQLSDLILENGSTAINLDAQINNDESHNFFVKVENMPGEVLSTYLFEAGTAPLGGDINLNLVSSGFMKEPKIKIDLNALNISYNNVNFGSLTCNATHINSNTLLDVDFKYPKVDVEHSLLTVDASLPLNINYLDTTQILAEDSEILISLRSNDFDIGTFGNILPYIKDQSGKIKSVVDIEGTVKNLKSNGFLKLDNATFTSRQNNLDYSLGMNAIFKDQIVSLDSLVLSNNGGSKYSGALSAYGIINLQKLPFNDFEFTINGNLALLGKKSKTREANIYGDLLIKSEDDWEFKFEDDAYSFNGNIIVDRADLIYTSPKGRSGIDNGLITYKIIEDTSKINLGNQKFVKVLNEIKLNGIDIRKQEETIFNINTNILINNVAKFDFLIFPELSQRLSVETTGQLEFESVGDETKAQGSLSLLDGSRLEFFKTFDATGSIRFENDITDPYFEVIATYIGEIDNLEGSRTEEVAVKLKLFSAFSKLQETLSKDKDNLSLYVGRSDIDNNIRDSRYDQSNALTFILFNQLNLDLSSEQQSTLSDLSQSAAFSLLGSQITNYLGSDLISNIRLNKYSGRDSYKLLFSGKYNNIRYSFGGSFGPQTNYLQLGNADIKVEYLFSQNLLLRVEQKNPIIESTTDIKIQELGLKYKIEF